MQPKPSVNISGMDPGSSTFGLATINFDPKTFEINYTEAHSVSAARYGPTLWSSGTDAEQRIAWIERYMYDFFLYTTPVAFGIETNFIKMKTASAVKPLIETVAAAREALRAYRSSLFPYLITPVQGKSAVGAGNKAKDKTLLPYIRAVKELRYQGDLSLEQLDEHALDAIVITYALFTGVRRRWMPDLASMEIIPCLKPPKRKR